MRRTVLAIAFLIGLVVPAAAQKAQIEAVNAKWMDLFNKGDFAGIGELYTTDAVAFPPGAAMVRGKAAIGAMWKGLAEQAGNLSQQVEAAEAAGDHVKAERLQAEMKQLRSEAAGYRKAAAELSRTAVSRQKANFALNAGNQQMLRGDVAGAIGRYQDLPMIQ